MSNCIAYFVVDWGTSNFRLFGLNAACELIDSIEAPIGLLQVKDKQFAQALEPQLAKMTPRYAAIPVVMAGMVGSANGWHQVPYVSAPASATALLQGAFRFSLPWGANGVILPGVSCETKPGSYDVMRGEEIQVMGALAHIENREPHIVLPGTHSKHVVMMGNAITSFSTFFTGELFALLSKGSSLIPDGVTTGEFSEDAFLKGVERAQNGMLLNDLFSVRPLLLFRTLTAAETADYLSGVIIGAELRCVSGSAITLVGGDMLCQRYLLAVRHISIDASHLSGNRCFIDGISSILKELSFD